MKPHLRPSGLITLVNRSSSTIYSGMFPGLIAGKYDFDEVLIDLYSLASRARVSFVIGEISAIDQVEQKLFLKNRPPIRFSKLSLDVGSETKPIQESFQLNKKDTVCGIKPFHKSYEWIKSFDDQAKYLNNEPFTVIGSGHSAIEMVLALRERWPKRLLQLKAYQSKINASFRRILLAARIDLKEKDYEINGPVLLCTGSKPQPWIEESGLPVNDIGRVRTTDTFQVINNSNLFAVGDCGIIANKERPASGVWAVRAARPLAINIERSLRELKLLKWDPQKIALQLIGGNFNSSVKVAWVLWGPFAIGPNLLFWKWKEVIDRKFMAMFTALGSMEDENESLLCRGCASKVPAITLKEALLEVGLDKLSNQPEDAAVIFASQDNGSFMQSMDGFPALSSDPWLNARLTTLHACSDIWATGSSVVSSQAVITLPRSSFHLQKELLAQCLSGIKSALEPQNALLIGGHTFESRNRTLQPLTLGIEISLCVNGRSSLGHIPWRKGGLEDGDILLLSRGLGSGIIFSGAMQGVTSAADFDEVLSQLSQSQHVILEDLKKINLDGLSSECIHACTDITGFGLIGHLGEMIISSNISRSLSGKSKLQVTLDANRIPSFPGVEELIKKGVSSSLAPSNRRALSLLKPCDDLPPLINLNFDTINETSQSYRIITELIVDPQTCGPLLISCSPKFASNIIRNGSWKRIGFVSKV